jgi:rod shape determining protein RodA
MVNLSDRGVKKSVDWKLVGAYLLLVLIGWVNIYASIHSGGPASIFDFNFNCGRQFIWILSSIALAAIILFVINPRIWESIAVPAYLFVLILLVAVIFLGIEVKGSRSWFEFGPVRFQPAEISKISTSLLLATLMSQANYKISRAKDLFLTLLVIGIPMVIILAESEAGSALVYISFIFVLYREGLSGWWLFCIGMAILLFVLTLTVSPLVSAIVLAGTVAVSHVFHSRRIDKWFPINLSVVVVFSLLPWILRQLSKIWDVAGTVDPLHVLAGIVLCAVPYFIFKGYKNRNSFLPLSAVAIVAGLALIFSTDFLFDNVLQEHQRKRIEVLLGMKDDPTGVGYNVNQSMIAIGSGGFTGKGFLNGTQTTFGFVPEQSTDFIFCTVGEEWGFLGSALVIFLYVFMIWRVIHNAERSREAFTRIYGYCVASCIFMHLFINIGMTIGLVPVIGIPLPFLSYGGSSLWAFTILLFISIALFRQEKKYY